MGLLALPAAAQQTPRADSLRHYELAEIVVGAWAQAPEAIATMQRVPAAVLEKTAAPSVAELARLIPAAHAQTNSRGEALVYLRGAGERQTALFFDGALLNVPWDNRYDLSMLPASVVGGMTVAKGPASVLYGTNVLGGALNLTARTLDDAGRRVEAAGAAAWPQGGEGSLTYLLRQGAWTATASAGLTAQDGIAVPGAAELPFGQAGRDVRLNTDRRLLHLFGRAGYRFRRGAALGVSLLHVDGEKGVAPEGHLDPGVARPRYWRYPEWRHTVAIVHAAVPGASTTVRGAAWVGRFGQTIDQYANAAYERVTDQQVDDDLTAGARLTALQAAGPGYATLVLNVLTSRHDQQDRDVAAEGTPEDAPTLTYRQHLLSAGGEYEARWGALVLAAGATLDAQATPATGDKPPREALYDYGLKAGAAWAPAGGLTLRAATGRKVRFPTLRELFGEALRRFLLNPDLTAEYAWLTELGVHYQAPRLAVDVTGFYNRTFDTIDQEAVKVEGQTKRRRVNLEGSRVVGVEVVGTWQATPVWSLGGHLTGLQARAYETNGTTRPLAEKPEWLGRLALNYRPPRGLNALAEGVYTGRAYAPAEEGTFVEMPTALAFNARLGYRFGGRLGGEVFARADNITDVLVLPQLGLPDAGRTFRLGLKLYH